MAKYRIIMVRHGESRWDSNSHWYDLNPTSEEVQQALKIGKFLRESGTKLDLALSSASTKAQKTLDIILKELGQKNVPKIKSWNLNALPFWDDVVKPEIKAGKSIIIVANDSSLWGIRQYFDQLSNEYNRNKSNLQVDAPLIHILDENLKPVEYQSYQIFNDLENEIVPMDSIPEKRTFFKLGICKE